MVTKSSGCCSLWFVQGQEPEGATNVWWGGRCNTLVMQLRNLTDECQLLSPLPACANRKYGRVVGGAVPLRCIRHRRLSLKLVSELQMQLTEMTTHYPYLTE